jgi:hypothetical protein
MSTFSEWILSKSPTVYLRLNEASGVPQDSSGNANHMASDSITTYQQPGGVLGDSDYAVSLAAGQGSESGLGFTDLPSTQMTWAALVKASGTPASYSNIIAQGWTHPGGFIMTESATELFVGVTDNSGTPTQRNVHPGATIPRDGKFHRIIGTFDGSYVRQYVDGVQVGSDVAIVVAPTCWASGYTFSIGGPKSGTDNVFVLDEVSVHKTAWTAEDVAHDWALVAGTLLTIKQYKSVAEILAYADPSADGANNAWTKSTGTAGWSLLDDGVRSPTAPSTGTDQITSGTAGQLQDLVLPNTLTYTAGAEYTLWIYSSSGVKRGLSTLISVNDSSFASSAVLHGASAAFAWRSRDISSLIASQGNLDGLRVRLSVDSTAGGGGAGVVTVAAVYVRKYVPATSEWVAVKLKYGASWPEKSLRTL